MLLCLDPKGALGLIMQSSPMGESNIYIKVTSPDGTYGLW